MWHEAPALPLSSENPTPKLAAPVGITSIWLSVLTGLAFEAPLPAQELALQRPRGRGLRPSAAAELGVELCLAPQLGNYFTPSAVN